MNETSTEDERDALIKSFVLASHGDLETVRSMIVQHPNLLNAPHKWGEGDYETPIGAAGHVGNRQIAEFLLDQGAPLDICVAAMLGHDDEVGRLLREDPSRISSTGAHGIPLMFHAALGGVTAIAGMVADGASEAAMNFALHAAIMKDHDEMVAWLMANGVTDTTVRDYQGRTPLEAARDTGNERIVTLLESGPTRQTSVH